MCGSNHHENGSQLYPPLPDEVREVARSLAEGTLPDDMYSRILESICGATDDSQPVEQYDGTLGVTTAFVSNHQAPVGQLQWNDNLATIYDDPGNVACARWCTGTLISRNLFLTAGHCLDSVPRTPRGWHRPFINGTNTIIPPGEIATNMHVNFNFQVGPDGSPRPVQQFAVARLVEHRLGNLDFAIIEIVGDPGQAFGITVLASGDPQEQDAICIIGHPAGQRKRIEAGSVFELAGTQIRYNDIDTLGGNSGSSLLLPPAGTIVGVHTNGGCTENGGFNFGVRISNLLNASPTLQELA